MKIQRVFIILKTRKMRKKYQEENNMEGSKLEDVLLGKKQAEKVLKVQSLKTPPILTHSLF